MKASIDGARKAEMKSGGSATAVNLGNRRQRRISKDVAIAIPNRGRRLLVRLDYVSSVDRCKESTY
jgi:hypothetical protein